MLPPVLPERRHRTLVTWSRWPIQEGTQTQRWTLGSRLPDGRGEEPWDSGQVQSLWAFISILRGCPVLPGAGRRKGNVVRPCLPQQFCRLCDSSEIRGCSWGPARKEGFLPKLPASWPSCLLHHPEGEPSIR